MLASAGWLAFASCLGLLRFQLFLEISAMIGEFRSGRQVYEVEGFLQAGSLLHVSRRRSALGIDLDKGDRDNGGVGHFLTDQV